jgi:hypothetical protein
VLAAIKPSQRIVIIELPGWAPEHNSDYTEIITPDKDSEEDLKISKPKKGVIDPRNNDPRSTFVSGTHLFLVIINQESGISRMVIPRNN